MVAKDYLIIPSVAGLLDCFNTQLSKYSSDIDCICHLIKNESLPINNVFILGLFSYIYLNQNIYYEKQWQFRTEDLRSFFAYSRGGKSFDIKSELLKLNQVEFWWKDSSVNKLAEVAIIGRKTIVTSVYFSNLAKAMRALSEVEITTKSGYVIRRHRSSYVSLVKASIVSDSNKAAIEIVIEICKLVERRGTHFSGVAHLSIRTLIDRCATLRDKLSTATTNSRKNQILRDDFSRALLLLEKETSLYDAYLDMKVCVVGKLAVTGDGKIEIYHKGKLRTIMLRKERKVRKNEGKERW